MRAGPNIIFACGILLILAAAIAAYFGGLAGPFLFDDYPNLEPLGYWGQVSDIETLTSYVSTGFSGPTGRPVALLSFLLDSNTWPSSPEPFKKTNLLLHLVTGLLLTWLVHLLIKGLARNSGSAVETLLPLVCLAWWLLNPLWVSTVLYVVQRMAILAALFSLLAIVLYLKARNLLYYQNPEQKWVGFFLLLISGLSALLAVFSKENAIILPVLILLIELAYFSVGNGGRSSIRTMVLIASAFSSGIILIFLLKKGVSSWDVYDPRRDFSVGERFWTQGRVMWMYLYDLCIPKMSSAGLFQEVEPSRGAWSPPSGAIGWILLLVFLGVTARYISRIPFTFLGIWLFFSAHLIESTVISLELYFEHRNYLPATFLSLAFVDLCIKLAQYRKFFIVGISLFIFSGLVMLKFRSDIWASYPKMVQVWAQEAPRSLRANLEASRVMLGEGRGDIALLYLQKAENIDSNSPKVALWRLSLTCRSEQNISQEQFDDLKISLASAEESGTLLQYLGLLAEGEGSCGTLDAKFTEIIIESYLGSDKVINVRTKSRLEALLGIVAARLGQSEKSLRYFISSMNKLGSANTGMLGVSWLARENHYSEAKILLDLVEEGIREDRLLENGINYSSEIEHMRSAIDRNEKSTKY